MRKNPSIPILKTRSDDPLPGFLYCRLYHEKGYGLGAWEVTVAIDPSRNEYNDKVSLTGCFKARTADNLVKELKENGIRLNDRELQTIIRLSRSEEFRQFANSFPNDYACDAGMTQLDIFSSEDRIVQTSFKYDFFRWIMLPQSKYHREALRWTRGLRHIYRKACPIIIRWTLNNL